MNMNNDVNELSNRVNTDDPFLLQYQPADLQIASEFLTNWLPFLCRDLCQGCSRSLTRRIRSLDEVIDGGGVENSVEEKDCDANSLGSWKDVAEDNVIPSPKQNVNGWRGSNDVSGSTSGELVETGSQRMSWADMAQEDELGEEEDEVEEEKEGNNEAVNQEDGDISPVLKVGELSRQEREYMRFMQVRRKKDFICLEKIKGKIVNILSGLELHCGVFSAAEQKRIVDFVYELQERGRKGELKGRTFTAPQKWMRGKGRVTIQFGCCYNYATDKNGNPPGILKIEPVDPVPHLFKVMIRRLVKWHVLPTSCVPDSCIVNIYDEGDCIPPHIDNHDFVRPFCTVSFLSECNIVFGSNLQVVGAGEFAGPMAIPLPVGSVLVLNGNAADVAKHCVPAVPTKRISITFRRMDESKRPSWFVPEPDLQGIESLPYKENTTKPSNHTNWQPPHRREARTEANEHTPRRFDNRAESYHWSSRRGSGNKRRTRVNLGN